jgi:hypothetical protein
MYLILNANQIEKKHINSSSLRKPATEIAYHQANKGVSVIKIIAIIPARGGSKSIPGKNIKKLMENP